MAELVDAYVSGAYARKGVGVRLPLPALEKRSKLDRFFYFPLECKSVNPVTYFKDYVKFQGVQAPTFTP